RPTVRSTTPKHSAWPFQSVPVKTDGKGCIRRAVAQEPAADFAGTLGGCRLPSKLQRGGTVLCKLKLLCLDRLFCLQRQQLVGGLHGLQRAAGRLALSHQVG